MFELGDACTVAAAALLIVAALHDVAVRTVPNTIVVVLAIIGLVLAAAQHRLPGSCVAAGLTLVLGGVLWARRLIGGGDAKLLFASAIVIAPWHVPAMLLATALAGGVLSLPYLPGRRLIRRSIAARPTGFVPRLLRCERWRLSRRGPLPYAVAIAAGALFVLFTSRG